MPVLQPGTHIKGRIEENMSKMIANAIGFHCASCGEPVNARYAYLSEGTLYIQGLCSDEKCRQSARFSCDSLTAGLMGCLMVEQQQHARAN